MHAAQANEVHLVIVLDHYIVMHSDILHVHTWWIMQCKMLYSMCNVHMACGHDDSTIHIVLVLFIIIMVNNAIWNAIYCVQCAL